MAAAVATRQLRKVFDEVVAVAGLDLTIAPGTVFGLLGSNGAGKSTAIKMLVTLLPMTAGEATVAGFDVRRDPRRVREHIGYVPQML